MMLSNGGLTHIAEAKRVPVQLLESGPAAGALAGALFGKRSQTDDVLAFDMGGTTPSWRWSRMARRSSLISSSEPRQLRQAAAAGQHFP